MSSSLAYTRSGSGAPLVLLHGIGLNRSSWNPVVPALARHFDVIAVDLPGFGDSAEHFRHTRPGHARAAQALAEAVAGLLAELGVTTPHLAGNSLGGWVALELAALFPVASVTLLDPAGLWKQDAPLYCRISLRASRWLARHAARPLSRLVRLPAGPGPRARPDPRSPHPADARIRPGGHRGHGHLPRLRGDPGRHGQAKVPGHRAHHRAGDAGLRLAGRPAAAPSVPAPGPASARYTSRNAARCGHVPMADDPGAVAELITRTAARAGQAPAVR